MMRKLIIIFMTLFSFSLFAEEGSPKNGLIWYKSYKTFNEASKDIKKYGNSDGYLDLYSTSMYCNILSIKKDNIKLNINTYCYSIGGDPLKGYTYDIHVYGNDMIDALQKDLRIGYVEKFETLIWSSLDQVYIMY